jgi:Domain of unknown function (DUF4402)
MSWGQVQGRRAALAAIMLATAMFPAASRAAPGSAKADATIVTPLSLIKDEDLEFGSILASGTAGTLVVPPSGLRTSTGGVILAPGVYFPSRFAGFGKSGQSVQISLGANSITLNRVGGGATMTVDTFVIGSTPTAILTTNPQVFTIGSANGIFNFPVGATLRVGANQAAGSYAGTFTMTLVYQ